jgi:hypothetical protein
MFQFFVVADNLVTYFATGFNDQAGNIDKGVDKTLKFHSNDCQP